MASTSTTRFLPILLLSLGCLVFVESDGDYNLIILHTNDVHSRFEPFTANGATCSNTTKEDCYGGVARRAGFIKDMRQKYGEILLLDAGDQFQGTPWFYIYKGEDSSHFMNELNYTAMSLGNHEFDNGVPGLEPFMKNITFPLLCSNLNQENTPDYLKKIEKSMDIKHKGKDIAIIGYITDAVGALSNTSYLKFDNEIETTKKLATEATNKGIKVIIALGHAGYDNDVKMAREIPDLDIIVGGHSHSLLYSGAKTFRDSVIAEYPTVVTHDDGRKTLIVQAGTMGKFVGFLEVSFDEAGNVKTYRGNPVLMDKTIQPDPTIELGLRRLNDKVAALYEKVVGTTSVVLDANENICRVEECTIGNMVTDSLVSFFQNKRTNCRIGFHNGGGLRSTIEKGDIKFNDIITTFPFGNSIIIALANGKVIKDVMEHSVTAYSRTNKQGRFMQMSGLKVSYDLNRPTGDRVVSIQVATKFNSSEYTPLDYTEVYEIALPKYLFKGGDGYTMFKDNNCTTIEFDAIDQDVILEYLAKYSPIKPEIEGRIRFVDSRAAAPAEGSSSQTIVREGRTPSQISSGGSFLFAKNPALELIGALFIFILFARW